MYRIYADDNLIYDGVLEELKITKGSITLESGKSGSFSLTIPANHPYYHSFVRMRTIVKVTLEDGKIIFRGRVLSDVEDFWGNKTLTCEGERGFLNDSIIRPFSFSGSPTDLFAKFLNEHNTQVGEFKKFKIGKITVVDKNNYIVRSNDSYEDTLENLESRLTESELGGYFQITHGEVGKEEIPTINYLAETTGVATQTIEFGKNLKDFSKTVKADEIATAIIPLGAENETETNSENEDSDGGGERPKLTIADVNGGKDYIYDPKAVEVYDWIVKVVEFSNVTVASNLLEKAKEHLKTIVQQLTTIELTAIDLQLLDRKIEGFQVDELVRIISKPHGIDTTMLCNKIVIDLLRPDNSTLTLGAEISSFSDGQKEIQNKIEKVRATVGGITSSVDVIKKSVADTMGEIEQLNGRVEKLENGSGAEK